jgi:hypothetical protein
LDRLTKQKEAALLEAERTVQIAMAKAAMVDDMQNKNQELIKQIEICQVNEVYCILQGLYNKLIGKVLSIELICCLPSWNAGRK